jgi:hypothetical protein
MIINGFDQIRNIGLLVAPADPEPNDDCWDIIFRVTTAAANFFQTISLWFVDAASWVKDRLLDLLPRPIAWQLDENRFYADPVITEEMNAQERTNIIKAVGALPLEERATILNFAVQAFTPNMNEDSRRLIIQVISRLQPDQRADIMTHSLQLMNPDEQLQGRLEIIRTIANLAPDLRAVFVAQRRELRDNLLQNAGPNPADVVNVHDHNQQVVRDAMRRRMGDNFLQNARPNVANGVNVHDRDQQVRDAMHLLRGHQQSVREYRINQGVAEFTEYLNNQKMDHTEKQLARDALSRPKNPDECFGPLISNIGFSIAGLSLSGQEVVGRLWVYASDLTEPDQTNAKIGMISALKKSYDSVGARICDPGKTQALVIAVLQGRLTGVNIELTEQMQVTTADSINMFFNVESNRNIKELQPLIQAAETFCNQNSLINREDFLNGIREYARIGGIFN